MISHENYQYFNFSNFFLQILGKDSKKKTKVIWGKINNIKVKIERIVDPDSGVLSSYFILTKITSDQDVGIKNKNEKINEKSLRNEEKQKKIQKNERNEESDIEEGRNEEEGKKQKSSKREKNNDNDKFIDFEIEKKFENLLGKNKKIKLTKEFHQYTRKLKMRRFLIYWNR